MMMMIMMLNEVLWCKLGALISTTLKGSLPVLEKAGAANRTKYYTNTWREKESNNQLGVFMIDWVGLDQIRPDF